MEKISLSQIGLYNPRRQNSELTEKLFVIRQKQFEMLMDAIADEKENSIPQHHIIIAQRGMGKTTMLHRIAIELHKPEYSKKFIPLEFPEEQYNITNLGDFWLNCLDALADSLEFENYDVNEIEYIDNQTKELSLHKNMEETASQAYRFFMKTCQTLKRRPVLLVDNIGLLFYRLDKNNKHGLRALLSENGAPIIMGAGVVFLPSQISNISDSFTYITNYDEPFYDYFQIHYLKKLSFEEFQDLLINLSKVTQSDISIIYKETPRLKTLHQLTGGNPRTTVMLFKLIVKGFSEKIEDDLDALLDEFTPLYKARFEETSSQSQTIIATIALNWEPISLRKISQQSGYANNQLSPQLKRLIEEGWIETTPAENAKGNAYFIEERLFSFWFIMRLSRRHKKQEINFLTKFLESFYGNDLERAASNHLSRDYQYENDFILGLALKNSKMLDKKIKKQFENKIVSSWNNEIIKNEDLKDEIINIKNKQVQSLFKEGNAYYDTGNFDKAIECYQKAIELKPDKVMAYYYMGAAYENKCNYDKAIECNEKAFEFGMYVKSNLQKLYRDKLKKISKENISEAKKLFNEIKDKLETDERFLQETLFELHNRNEGIAKSYLSEALQNIQDKLAKLTIESWFYFAAICLNLNYGKWFLDILKEKGFNKILFPYFVAVQALEIEQKENKEKAEIYLKNRAIEISEPARMIIEKIKKY
jgi:tetratricopeptide (TPR) repeat protein